VGENEIWLLKSMEIVVHSNKPLFQQTFRKKLYHFNRNSQFRSVMSKIQFDIRSRTKNPTSSVKKPTHPKTSGTDYATLILNIGC